MKLTDIVQKNDTLGGKLFDWATIALILYSVLTLTIETLPNLSPTAVQFLEVSEIVVTVLFTIEYSLRVATSRPKLKYVFSFYGLIDLIAIAPFYLSLGFDVRSIRLVRLVRIFRLLKLNRYTKAIDRFGRALMIAKEEIILFVLATIAMLYLSAVGIYYFEHAAQPEQFPSIPHSLWWAVATLTTVGYGDVYPITMGGKVFTFFMLMLGLGIVAVPAGLMATALTEVRKQESREKSG